MFSPFLLSLLAAGPVLARSPEQITIDWSGLSARKIAGHKVEITLTGAVKFKTKLISASDQSLVVRARVSPSNGLRGRKRQTYRRTRF
jgi:hypothetical protein